MINNTKTAFKAIVAIALFASFIAIGCNDAKKEESTESVKTDTIQKPVGGDTTNADDTGKAHPVTPVNKEQTPPAN